jgi:hypothetical protein
MWDYGLSISPPTLARPAGVSTCRAGRRSDEPTRIASALKPKRDGELELGSGDTAPRTDSIDSER